MMIGGLVGVRLRVREVLLVLGLWPSSMCAGPSLASLSSNSQEAMIIWHVKPRASNFAGRPATTPPAQLLDLPPVHTRIICGPPGPAEA